VVILLWLMGSGGANAAGPMLAPSPTVGVYVNVDEVAALWPYRDPKTGALPKAGDAAYPAYLKHWQALIQQAFREIRQRVPREFDIFPATAADQPFTVRIEVRLADMRTHCGAQEFYKYLWVRVPKDAKLVTNWDGLGVRSSTLVSAAMGDAERTRAHVDSWVELWAQVPYLHVAPRAGNSRPE